MTRHHPRGASGFSTLRAAAAALIVLFVATAAQAYIIENQTGFTAICRVFVGDNPEPFQTFGVGGNSSYDCIAGTPCSPSTQFNDRYTLRVTMVWQYGLYENDIPLEVGGTVLIRMATRPWTNQPDIHLLSRDTFGAFIDETYPNFGEYSATTRNVQFIGTADCQYFHHYCCNDQKEEAGSPQPPFGIPSVCGLGGFNQQCPGALTVQQQADAVHAQIRQELAFNPQMRGVIIAGDLVQSGHPQEWNWYLDSFTSGGTKYTLLPHVFDGLGNHDYDSNIRHPIIREHIREHSRNTVRTFAGPDPSPHYSWDWHDIHFVQLNLIPSNAPPSGGLDFNPYGALTFLEQDLAAHVGTSGRPVFIIHHFGLNEGNPIDGGPTTWFDQYQKDQYWNVIAPYNVRGILHGHTHLSAANWGEALGGRWGRWNRPAGGVGGPAWVRTFNISASGEHGVFCELHMGPNNEITLVMRDKNGALLRERSGFNFEDDGKAVFVAPGPAGSGDGDQLYPWTSVQNAVNAVLTYPASVVLPVTPIKISAGTYTGAVSVNISRKVRLEATGGLVRIGQP